MTYKISKLNRFVLPAVAAVAATAVWITIAENVASGRSGSNNIEQPGLAAVFLSARHADANNDTQRAVSYLDAALSIDPNNTDLLQENWLGAL